VKSNDTPAHPSIWLSGYIADLPTPFDEEGKLDLAALAKLCECQIEAEVSAIVVGETAGDASTLTPVEHDSIVRAVVEIGAPASSPAQGPIQPARPSN
jgi:4-hydroxy-tetrahydrodipicolinate synthase